MNIFRKSLEDAALNPNCRSGNEVWFRPAQEFVPLQWVERMATLEWECSETGCCSHPDARTTGCYRGQWVEDQWICDTLLLDGKVVSCSLAEMLKHI